MAEQNNRLSTNYWVTFKAMVKRDLVVQSRDKWEFVFRVAMLPFMLILLYGSLVLHKYSQNILNYYFLEKSKKNRMLTQRMTISRKFCLFS